MSAVEDQGRRPDVGLMESQCHPCVSPILCASLSESGSLYAWVESFIQACHSRNLAPGTVAFYFKKLGVFVRYCEDLAISDVHQITADNIRQFMIFLVEGKHNPAGVHCFYRSVKTFLKWYEREIESEDWRNPIEKVKAPFVPLEPLDPVSIETTRAMMNVCARGSLSGDRDRAALVFLLDTGARLAEFLSLNVEDVNPITGAVSIRAGKGRKPRNVYLGEKSRQMLRRYLKQRSDYSAALWISRSGERLSETGLRMMLRRRATQAAVPVPSPHDFRRAFALERLRAGADLLTLSKLMGHTSLQVLNRYVKQAGEDLEQAARLTSPVDRNL
jgi:integrase/recombinase XerD